MDTKELLEELAKKLERLQKLEAAFAGTDAPTSSKKKGKGKTRKPMSQERRDIIAAAQTKRWKLFHAEKKKKQEAEQKKKSESS